MIGFLALSSNPLQSPPRPDPVVSAEYRRACSRFATGITIATIAGVDGSPQGLTANSFSSVSLDPPLVLVSVDVAASVHVHFVAAKSFAINILDETQRELSERFAFGRGDRFEGLDWAPGITGAPVIAGSLAVLECVVREHFEGGDHTIFLGEVVRAESRDGQPLIYYASEYRRLA
jgi:flavin reductase (DIM6/NTAB) family NADH-FMN oxidoreductase RutF